MAVDGKPTQILPQCDEFLRVVTGNILYNIRKGGEASVMLPPLVSRAYTLVHEVGVIPVRDYRDADKLIVEN